MDTIQASATFPAIAAADLDEFKQLAARALAAARDEPGTLQYDWYFSADETVCVVREAYVGSEAVLAHIGNVGPLLGRLVELGGGMQLDVFGAPSAALSDALAAFKPPVYAFAQGK